MNQIKLLFSRTTRRGRALRTVLQAIVGITSMLLGFVAIPGFYDWITTLDMPVQVATMSMWVGVISYLQNLIEDFLKWLDGGDYGRGTN